MTGDTLGGLCLRRLAEGAVREYFDGGGYVVVNAEDGSVGVWKGVCDA